MVAMGALALGCQPATDTSEAPDTAEKVATKKAAVSAANPVVAYDPNWSPMNPATIPWDKITHINVAFVGITYSGGQHRCGWLDFDWGGSYGEIPSNHDAMVNALVAARNSTSTASQNTKILLSVGGWTLSQRFSAALRAEESKVDTFIDSCVDMMDNLGVDGLDWDWEYPGRHGFNSGGPSNTGSCWEPPCDDPDDNDNFATMLYKVRNHSGMSGKLQTAAVYGNWSTSDARYVPYDYSAVESYMDFVNVMTYDYWGNWQTTTGFSAPFTEVKQAMNNWAAQMTDDSMLNMGVPFYSYHWTGTGSTAGASLSGPADGAQLAHGVVKTRLNDSGCTQYSSGDDQYIHCTNGDWYEYHDTDLVETKMDWQQTNIGGGGMFWMLTQDTGDNELTKAMFDTLNGDSTSPTCGDSRCEDTEDCTSCSTDCGACSSCGDDTCDSNETCNNCADDCGTCDSEGGDPGNQSCEVWEQKYAGQTPYGDGDKVLFGGSGYESLINNNWWSPADYPAGWTAVSCGATCTPDCSGLECGDDGCGGLCGTCGTNEECNGSQQCTSCTPSCGGNECGDDGCGGSCGTCDAGEVCNSGTCQTTCTPSCTDKACGNDDCGGSCGTCGTGETCNGSYQCEASGGGDCNESAWSSSTSYGSNDVATVTCAASPYAGTQCYGFASELIAVKCVGPAWCQNTNPNGTIADNGVWSRVATCE
jgi:GH18 family chitinase